MQKLLPSYFKKIVNYDYNNNDIFTHNLLQWYKDIVFTNINSDLLEKLDLSIYLYITDNIFHKKVKRYIKLKDINSNNNLLVNKIINLEEEYININQLKQLNSRWL